MSGNVLRFLITDKGSGYMNELKLLEIDMSMNDIAQDSIDTRSLKIKAGRKEVSLFDFASCLNEKFGCTLDFYLNDDKKDILMTCKRKSSGIILAAIVIFPNQDGNYEATLLTTEEK